MASILVISLCTEPPVGSGFLLWLCVRATRGGEGPVGGKKGFWLGVVKHGGKKRKRKRKGEGEGFRLLRLLAVLFTEFFGRSNSCRLKRLKREREREREIFSWRRGVRDECCLQGFVD